MQRIKQQCDHSKEEIEDAHEYIRQAQDIVEEDPDTADMYCELAGEELKHMEMLHGQVVKKINEWRKETGQELPEKMQARYDILHQIHTEDTKKVRLMIQLYKEER